MGRYIIALGLALGLASPLHAGEVKAQACSNPFFMRSALDALNRKNQDMKNMVEFLKMTGIKDISRGYNDYQSCRVTISDNQGLTYDGVLEWSVKAGGFKFTPDVQQPTD